ncbi:SHOCT domain-containing protein [Brevibacillus panacihumi]|uniref:SHOCT domain-containing protein n=1 Tax=Brevibacillus panacihumi TaxID=497735 RepID=UPI003CFF1FDB
MNGMMMTPFSMMLMCFLIFFALLCLIAFAGGTVYVIIRQLMKKSRVEDNPYMLLNELFVKGIINEDEYKQRQRILRGK